MLAFATQLTTAAFTAGLTLVLVRVLGPTRFGVFALAMSIGGVALVPSDFGITQAGARFVAERRGRREAVAQILSTALALKLVASTVVSLLLAAVAGPLARAFETPALVTPLRLFALAVFAQSVFLFLVAAFVAHGRMAVNLRLVLAESAAEAAATIGLVVAGAGAAGAAAGRALGYAAGVILGLAATVRLFGRAAISIAAASRTTARKIARYAGALAIVDGAFTVFAYMNGLVVGAYLGATAVGYYSAPSRLLMLAQYPGIALAAAIAPRVARHESEGSNVAALSTGLRLLTITQALFVAPVLVWAEPIVEVVLGRDYRASTDVLRAFAPFVFFGGTATLVSVSVNYLGYARRRIPIAIGVVVLNLALLALLLPTVGVWGAALALGASYAFYVGAHLKICTDAIHLPLGTLAATTVRSLAAAAAMSGVLALFGVARLTALDAFLGSVLGCAVFLATLVVTREVSPRDLRRGIQAIRRRLGAGGAAV